MAKVLMSMDDDLLARVDERARALGLSRSAFLAGLARDHLVGRASRVDPRVRRSIELARSACAGAGVEDVDTTEWIRGERDAR